MELLYLLARSSDQDVALAKNDIIMPVEKHLHYVHVIRTHLQLYMYIHRHCIQAYPNTEDRAGGQHKSLEKF